MTCIRLVLRLLLLSFSSILEAVSQDQTRRTNVVLVIFDDLRPVLGAYGDFLASTPNLDAFAQGSHVFTRAYSQVMNLGYIFHLKY